MFHALTKIPPSVLRNRWLAFFTDMRQFEVGKQRLKNM
jgi:hypothetical protein